MGFANEGSCRPNRPEDIYIRPTRTGDICILLEPCDPMEIEQIHQWQESLVTVFGGQRADVIHLTCQRFQIEHEWQWVGITHNLRKRIDDVRPFPITAVALSSLHEVYRDTNILKWCIQITDDLMNFLKNIEAALLESDITPLHKPSFVPTMVTALVNIPEINRRDQIGDISFPKPLFHAQQLQLSQICAPNEYKILETIEFYDA